MSDETNKFKNVFSESNRVLPIKKRESTDQLILQVEKNESVHSRSRGKLEFEPDNLTVPFYSKARDCTLYVNKGSLFNYSSEDREHPVIIDHNNPDYISLTFLISDDYSGRCDISPHLDVVINGQQTGEEEIHMSIGEINIIPENIQCSEMLEIDIICIDETLERLNVSDKIIFHRLKDDPQHGTVHRFNDRWCLEVRDEYSISIEERKELIRLHGKLLQPVNMPYYDTVVKFGYSNTYNPNDVIYKF